MTLRLIGCRQKFQKAIKAWRRRAYTKKDESYRLVSNTEFRKCEIQESLIGLEIWLEK
jgi:hypothetical protein